MCIISWIWEWSVFYYGLQSKSSHHFKKAQLRLPPFSCNGLPLSRSARISHRAFNPVHLQQLSFSPSSVPSPPHPGGDSCCCSCCSCCCKWSSGGASLLQMITLRDWLLANDHPDQPASCKWSSEGTGILQMIIRISQILLHFSFYSSGNSLFSSDKYHLLLQNISPFFFKSKDQGSISRTFLEQCVLVLLVDLHKFQASWFQDLHLSRSITHHWWLRIWGITALV